MKRDLLFTVETPTRLDLFLHEKGDVSRTFAQEQIKGGHISVNGRLITKPSHKLHLGDKVEGFFLESVELALEPIPYPLDVLYEDSDVLCINKPQDMVVHPASGYKGPTLVHYLLHYFRKSSEFKTLNPVRPGIIHRLDRGTSGVILIAKNRKASDLFSQLFKKRQIHKEYEAIVWGKAPNNGIYDNAIGRDRKDRKKMSSNTEKPRPAWTQFSLLLQTNHFSHVALFPKTGRTHQLRVHLSEARLPIVGDKLYGPKSIKNRVERLNPVIQTALDGLEHAFLHAQRVTFHHPISQVELSIEAKRPGVYDKFLALIKNFDK